MLATSTLTDRLSRRIEIEEAAQRSGKTFRRNGRYQKVEDLLIRPALKAGLQITGLYKRGTANALNPIVRRFEVASPRLPSEFDGFRLLHLSDFHIDCLPDLAAEIAYRVRALPCDICVMTGDYRFAIEGSADQAILGMRQIVGNVQSRNGVLGILGNHDSCEIAPALDAMGVQMLINDAVEIRRSGRGIWFAGIDDPYDYRCDDLDLASQPIPRQEFSVLLAHTPDLYQRAADAAYDLYLCGHTHAGQIRFPVIGSVMQNSNAPRAYTHGRWQHGHMHGYTSAGIGSSMLPVRFNCPPELVLITLRRG